MNRLASQVMDPAMSVPMGPATRSGFAERQNAGVISSREILAFLWLWKWLIAIVAVAVTAAGCVLTLYVLSPTYEASASLMIDASQVRPVIEAAPPSDFEKVVTFQTQIDIIKSTGLAGQVVAKLDLGHKRALSRIDQVGIWARAQRRWLGRLLGIQSWQKPDDPVADATAYLIANTDVQAKPQSVVLKITYFAHDPNEAANTVNALVDAYTGYFNQQIAGRATGVVNYLDAQLKDVGARLAAAEQALLEFRQNDRFVLNAAEAGPAGAGSAQGAATPAAAAAPPPRAGPDATPGLTGVTDSPKVAEEMQVLVLGMDDELRKLMAQYPPSYPPAVALRTKIARYVAALNELPRKELEFTRLQRRLDAEQDTYKYLRQNLERARIVEVGNTNAIGLITVLERAEANDRPISPKPRLIIPGAAIFGVLLGMVLAGVANFFDTRIYSEHALGDSLAVPVLGALPRA